SNKTLAVLLLVAVVASLASTWLLLLQRSGLETITGRQSSAGTAQLTVETAASISFVVNTVDWGTGRVNTTGGNQVCNLTTETTNVNTQCIGFNQVSTPFQIENDGSTNISVKLASNKNNTEFIGGDPTLVKFQYRVINNESSSCETGLLAGGYREVNITSPGTLICGKLLFDNTKDSLAVHINITIPYDAPATAKTATLTATGATVV
ncbi:hypothetical protein HY642_07270, partial [Candidatus Woesearchaeota archaeon]|nr:hypothetical protein [Candidatus Woesearchaeota archaeon]